MNTDSQTKGPVGWSNDLDALTKDTPSRFAARITRVEIHLNDENSAAKSGANDKRCQVEVRIAGLRPFSVSDLVDSQERVLYSAVNKMISLIETVFGKLDTRPVSRRAPVPRQA